MKMTLKAARINAGLTQVDAAKHLGISPSTLISYEAGRTYPDVEVLKKIEVLYNISYNDIIFSCPDVTV